MGGKNCDLNHRGHGGASLATSLRSRSVLLHDRTAAIVWAIALEELVGCSVTSHGMKTTQLLAFTVPLGVMAAGFAIGGRDGALFTMVGAGALLVVSLWQAIKAVNRDDKKST